MTSRFCIPLSKDSAISKREEYEKDVIVFEERNLLVYFVGRWVTVRSAGWEAKGRLVRFEAGSLGRIHKPCTLLLLGDDKQLSLLRNWEVILKHE
ncbi:MAG: hypothetical protein ABSB28_08640 [Candidatus Bathyarchaeia archaeon]